MSLKTSTLVWKHSRQSGSDLVMLLALSDFADDNGVAYPAIATLARMARMSVRNAHYVLKRLAASGELSITPNAGPKGCNLFKIDPAQPLQAAAPLQTSAPVQPPSETPAAAFRKPLQPAAPEPSLNHQEPLLMSGKPDFASETRSVLEHLNRRAGRNYRPVESTLKPIRARLKSGVTTEDCRRVIDAKVDEWVADPKMAKYLRPKTIFDATKFEQYLGALGTSARRSGVPSWVAAGFGSADEAARAEAHA